MPGTINGWTIAYTTVGGIILWSGITGTTLSTTFQGLLKGQAPSQNQEPITPAATSGSGAVSAGYVGTPNTAAMNTGASTATAAANQAIGRLAAAPYGWATGNEWASLVSLWNRESTWNNQATNPTSGAYGIAQALGHGQGLATEGSVTNEYGGYGVSDAVAQEANSGSASAQIAWGLAYIQSTYGTPAAAWAHEESAGFY